MTTTARLDTLQIKAAQFTTEEVPMLDRILVEPDGTVVATDGHRLAIVPPDRKRDAVLEGAVVVEAPRLRDVLRGRDEGPIVPDPVEVEADGSLRFEVDAAAHPDGVTKFPNYRAILDHFGRDGLVDVFLEAKYVEEFARFARVGRRRTPLRITFDPAAPQSQVRIQFKAGARVVTLVLMPMLGELCDFEPTNP